MIREGRRDLPFAIYHFSFVIADSNFVQPRQAALASNDQIRRYELRSIRNEEWEMVMRNG